MRHVTWPEIGRRLSILNGEFLATRSHVDEKHKFESSAIFLGVGGDIWHRLILRRSQWAQRFHFGKNTIENIWIFIKFNIFSNANFPDLLKKGENVKEKKQRRGVSRVPRGILRRWQETLHNNTLIIFTIFLQLKNFFYNFTTFLQIKNTIFKNFSKRRK